MNHPGYHHHERGERVVLHGGRRHRIARVQAKSSPTALRRWPGVDVVTQKGCLARKREQHASDGRPASVRQLKGLGDRDAGQGGVAFSAPGSGTIDDVSVSVEGAYVDRVDIVVIFRLCGDDEGG